MPSRTSRSKKLGLTPMKAAASSRPSPIGSRGQRRSFRAFVTGEPLRLLYVVPDPLHDPSSTWILSVFRPRRWSAPPYKRSRSGRLQSKLTAHLNRTNTQRIVLSGPWMASGRRPTSSAGVQGFSVRRQSRSADPRWRKDRLLESGHDAMINHLVRLAQMLEAT